MPIETELTGEEARELVNKIGISRMGFDGHSCYYFLKDESALEVRPIHVMRLRNGTKQPKLKFNHIVFLPTDPQVKHY